MGLDASPLIPCLSPRKRNSREAGGQRNRTLLFPQERSLLKSKITTRLSVALVMGAALSAVVLSQISGERVQARAETSSSVASLLGNQVLKSDDPRFRPVAMALMNEASGEAQRGSVSSVIFRQTVVTDYINRYVFHFPASMRAEPMRSLTPSEILFLEELFSQDLRKANRISITRTGINGSIEPNDVGVRAADIASRAKARAAKKSEFYSAAAKAGISAGQAQ